ncbi:MAG: YdiU family protein [Saprospiraceae bacterium]|nr:YdiU family protein [Saprospiraceae bacterium]
MMLTIQDTFNKELPADKNTSNTRRQVLQACYSFVTPRIPSNPSVVHVSKEMAEAIGIESFELKQPQFKGIFSGALVMKGTQPYAMCYGGHQFGSWAGQLGDGRAINLGEVVHNNQRWALQLKGAGETPYSRTADGLAVLRSSIREHLCSEAMFHLGVPTTRSLSLCLTGDQVMRDVMYDGNPEYEKGAVVCRVAESFIRFGNFQIFASRKDDVTLKALTDYTIKYFYPEIKSEGKEKYIAFFNAVLDRTLHMVVHWQRVGFVHGVMNTDNMSILGQTIDYGPYGWLEDYNKDWTPNTTDRQQKRYRFGNQPGIAQWNLFQLANALFPLIGEAKPLEDALKRYIEDFTVAYQEMMRSKLGLQIEDTEDAKLIEQLEETLSLTETDMTIFFRKLADLVKEDDQEIALKKIRDAFYQPELMDDQYQDQWKEWLSDYIQRINRDSFSDLDRKALMNKTNPKYVLRNYMAQLAIDAADKGDYTIIEELHQILKRPYEDQPSNEKWFAKRPEWARHKVGCSMLSCSS